MDSVRVSAKTVQDALMEAAIELGTSSDNIEYTVIDEGSKGFFGIGGRKATIEAKKKVTDEDLMKEIFDEKPSKPRKETKKEYKKDYKQDYRQEKKDGKKEQKKTAVKESAEKSGPSKNTAAKEAGRKGAASGESVQKEVKEKDSTKKNYNQKEFARNESVQKTVSQKDLSQKDFSQKETGKKESVKKESELNESGKREYAKKEYEHAVAAQESAEEDVLKVPRVPADPEEAKKRAVDFLTDVLKAMGMEAEIQTEFEDGNLSVNIEGEDMGIMIGKRGQTLDSLQYLTSLVVNKGKASYVRVKLDTEDYRSRRKATLENLARNIASKVKKTRRPVFLEPMNPYERRIIHSALQNDPYVTTHSEGDEPYRKVVVTLKRDRDYDRKGDGYSRYHNYNRRNRYSRESFELEDEKSTYSEDTAQSEPVSQEEE